MWERTPKTGEAAAPASRAYAARRDPGAVLELLLALFFAGFAPFAWSQGHPHPVPFLLLLATGLGYVGVRSLRAGG